MGGRPPRPPEPKKTKKKNNKKKLGDSWEGGHPDYKKKKIKTFCYVNEFHCLMSYFYYIFFDFLVFAGTLPKPDKERTESIFL